MNVSRPNDSWWWPSQALADGPEPVVELAELCDHAGHGIILPGPAEQFLFPEVLLDLGPARRLFLGQHPFHFLELEQVGLRTGGEGLGFVFQTHRLQFTYDPGGAQIAFVTLTAGHGHSVIV